MSSAMSHARYRWNTPMARRQEMRGISEEPSAACFRRPRAEAPCRGGLRRSCCLAASARESERARGLPGRPCVARSARGASASRGSDERTTRASTFSLRDEFSRLPTPASRLDRASSRTHEATLGTCDPARAEKAVLERRFRENAPRSASRPEMARTRQLVAPKGTGGLLSCALSPHDGGASLAVGGENAAALVFDLRGAHLVAHRLTAAAGCFDREDAVPCVSYNLAAPHALYCASGRVVTAWDVRRLPGAADARVRVGCVAGAAKSAPPTHLPNMASTTTARTTRTSDSRIDSRIARSVELDKSRRDRHVRAQRG